MTTELNTDGDAEVLRRRIDELEREHHERTARTNAALAAAQDRAYWLDRWNVDLNALMRRKGARETRATLRALRKIYRLLYFSRDRVKQHTRDLPVRLGEARRALEQERVAGDEAESEPFQRTLSPVLLRSAPVTELLYGRLGADDIQAIEKRLEPAEDAIWGTADELDRRRLALAFAAHHKISPALERSGLSADMPTPGVHAMTRGAPAAGGSTYYADLVVDSLQCSGLDLSPGMVGLDFGCSSGRVVRVLATAFPDLEWHGCDPIPDAIDWADAHLPGIAFERNSAHPPLSYPDARFDFVFAISIWSHFAETAALEWLGEMHRIIKPGGRLLLTTHGEETVAHTDREGLRSRQQLESVREALAHHGYWYTAEFGAAGDHGIVNPDWGTAFLTAEWLLARLTPEWRVGFFRPGRVAANQDLYVLERR